jgi:hypothetical protein
MRGGFDARAAISADLSDWDRLACTLRIAAIHQFSLERHPLRVAMESVGLWNPNHS